MSQILNSTIFGDQCSVQLRHRGILMTAIYRVGQQAPSANQRHKTLAIWWKSPLRVVFWHPTPIPPLNRTLWIAFDIHPHQSNNSSSSSSPVNPENHTIFFHEKCALILLTITTKNPNLLFNHPFYSLFKPPFNFSELWFYASINTPEKCRQWWKFKESKLWWFHY